MNKCKLSDIADIIVGYPFQSEFFNTEGSGIKLVRGMNVTERSLRFGTESRWWDDFSFDLSNYQLKENDILIGMDGSKVGRNFALVNKCDLPLLLVQRVACIRAKDKAYQPYLWFCISSKYFSDYVDLVKTGSSIFHISAKQIGEFPIDFKPFDIQKKIGNVLNNIENKININNAINTELESMAKTLYDYWFLQFEFPNEEGKPYKSSGGKMVWNEELKREIPEGWKIKKIGEIIDTSRGISYNSKTIEGDGVPMINLASFNVDGSYKPEGLKIYSGDYSCDKIVKPFELLMCNTQQTAIDFNKDIIGKALLVPDIFEDDIVTSHHVNTIRVEDKNMKFYLHRLFNTKHFHKYIAGYANGTNILGLIFSGVENYATEIPEKKILEKYSSLMLNIEKKKSEIIKENQELSSLRDFLLPLLMNGQVGFKE